MNDRDSIRELLPSHRHLLVRHRARISELIGLANADAQDLGGVIAELDGEFGQVAVEAGEVFVVTDPEHNDAVVVVLGLEGLIEIGQAVVPEAVQHILDRPPRTLPVLIVDGDDEPAVALMPANKPQAS